MEPSANVLYLARLAGGLARACGRPLDDNPHDPEKYQGMYDAWAGGWKGEEGVLVRS